MAGNVPAVATPPEGDVDLVAELVAVQGSGAPDVRVDVIAPGVGDPTLGDRSIVLGEAEVDEGIVCLDASVDGG